MERYNGIQSTVGSTIPEQVLGCVRKGAEQAIRVNQEAVSSVVSASVSAPDSGLIPALTPLKEGLGS